MKTTLLLLMASGLCAAAAETNVTRHACCAAAETTAMSPAGLTDKSLYQIESVWTNDAAAAVQLSSLRGRPQVVAMFFANCTYACPLLVYQMQHIQQSLPEALRDKVGFTLISFDPERDTSAALHSYRLQHSLGETWALLRGGPDDVLNLAALLNVKFKKDAQGQFLHSNVLTLLDAQGEIVCQQLGLNSDNQQLIRRASELAQK
jgi:protein SCO1/2